MADRRPSQIGKINGLFARFPAAAPKMPTMSADLHIAPARPCAAMKAMQGASAASTRPTAPALLEGVLMGLFEIAWCGWRHHDPEMQFLKECQAWPSVQRARSVAIRAKPSRARSGVIPTWSSAWRNDASSKSIAPPIASHHGPTTTQIAVVQMGATARIREARGTQGRASITSALCPRFRTEARSAGYA